MGFEEVRTRSQNDGAGPLSRGGGNPSAILSGMGMAARPGWFGNGHGSGGGPTVRTRAELLEYLSRWETSARAERVSRQGWADGQSKPKCCGFRPIKIAANTLGTNSRVSRGSARARYRYQKLR